MGRLRLTVSSIALTLASIAATLGSRTTLAELVVQFDPGLLTHQFTDSDFGGGTIPAQLGDRAGFVTDARSSSPGAPTDGFIDSQNNAAPIIAPHITQGSVWQFDGGQNLLTVTDVINQNADGFGTQFDANTMTAIVSGRISAASSGTRYLFDFRDDAPTGGGSNTANGFALRYDPSSGMLEGLAKQSVNAAVALPVGEWFVASYAWNGAAASATLSVQTITGYTASDTGAADTVALDPDQFRLGSATVGSTQRFTGSLGDVYFYNDVEDHSAVATQLANDYFDIPELIINRETGNISIVNSMSTPLTNVVGYQMSSTAGTLDPNQWMSIADNYDLSSPPANRRDPSNNWTKLTTDLNTRDDLSEAEFESNGGLNNGATFPAGSTTSLGNAWIPYYLEDVTMELLFDDGSTTVLDVRFTGNGGSPFLLGDLNFDGSVDEDDFYDEFLPNYGEVTSALTSGAEKYALGDINEDGAINITDFVILNNAYRAANPLGAALDLSGARVPEPGALILVASAMVTGLALRCRKDTTVAPRPRTGYVLAVLLALTIFGSATSTARAELAIHFDPNVLESMFFDGGTSGGTIPAVIGDRVGFISDVRADNYGAAGSGDDWHDLEGSNSSNNLNTVRPQIVAHPHLGTVWAATGGQSLLGRPTDSGFTDGHVTRLPSTTNSITAIVAGRASSSGSTIDYLFDFRDDEGDLNDAIDGFAIRYNHDTGMLEGVSKQTANTSVEIPTDDWFVAMYVWNGPASTATLTVETLSGISATNTGAASSTDLQTDRWRVTNNSAGSTTAGTGWDGLMGDLMIYSDVLNHTDAFQQLVMDYLPNLEIQVNRTNGEVMLVNESSVDFTIDAYTISSEMNSLDHNAWSTLDSQEFDSNAWTQLDASPNLVSEGAFSLTGSVIAPGTSISLGHLFDESVGVEDLQFAVHIAGASPTAFTAARVTYFDGPGGVQGDFNGDGMVNLADYTVWRDHLGGNETALNGNGSGNATVGTEDYNLWKANFGTGGGSGAIAAANVPEPRAAMLLGLILTGIAVLRRHRVALVPCRVLALVGIVSIATSASALTLDDVLDRHYTMGDYNDGSLMEFGASGGPVGSNFGGPGHDVLDSFAIEVPDYIDLGKAGDPRYHQLTASDISNGYVTGTVGTYGIHFNAANSDHLTTATTINNLATTGQGVQFWAKPSAAGLAAGLRQSLLFDTSNFGGPAITTDGRWTMTSSNHANDTDIGSTATVVGDRWVHVAQQVYLRGDSQLPRLIPGSGNILAWTAVLYIDGVAVAANNDDNTTASGDFVIGADNRSGTMDNFYSGVIDEVKVYVQDANEFFLLEDNEFVASYIDSSYIAAGKAPGTAYQPGDINLDGDVDPDDIPLFVAGWNKEKILEGAHRTMYVGDLETLQWGDFNLDGKVDIRDAGTLHVALKNAGFAGLDFDLLNTTTVPEPSTCLLLAAGSFILLCIRSHLRSV